MGSFITKSKYFLRSALWILNGYLGRNVSSRVTHKATILITYYNPVRLKLINHQLRNILKCTFVEKLIVSNHNPEITINNVIQVNDQRLVSLNQPIKRACGYRWRIARELDADYLIVIDDDILLFPQQLKVLFEQLITQPAVPHGFSGMLHLKNGEFQYREREDIDVHYLCEVYAVTKKHVEKYFDMVCVLAEQDETLPELIERLGDFIVISQTGTHNPKIHRIGRVFKSETFKMPGIANHMDHDFPGIVSQVSHAVEKMRPLLRTQVM